MRRSIGRRTVKRTWSSVRRPVVAVPALLALALCLYFVSASALLRRRSALPGERQVFQLPGSRAHSCVAWRQTNFCSPYGCAAAAWVAVQPLLGQAPSRPAAARRTRAPSADRGCGASIVMGPGFCECANRLTVRRCAPRSSGCPALRPGQCRALTAAAQVHVRALCGLHLHRRVRQAGCQPGRRGGAAQQRHLLPAGCAAAHAGECLRAQPAQLPGLPVQPLRPGSL